jgi:hypothetical protein
MEDAFTVSTLSAHLRFDSREIVADTLGRMGIATGTALPVYPPRRLPPGLFVSPVRNGWVSLWSPMENTRDWFPALTETLECAGVLLEVVESRFWIVELLRDGQLLGRMEQPEEAVKWDDLWARATDSLQAEGLREPWNDEERVERRMEEIAAGEEYREDMRRMEEQRAQPGTLAPFLPPFAAVERAWELLTTAGTDAESSGYAEDQLEAFAGYLGIRDAAWDPEDDAEALSEGDYEDEEGLPEGWREFVLLPVPQLRVL